MVSPSQRALTRRDDGLGRLQKLIALELLAAVALRFPRAGPPKTGPVMVRVRS